MSFGVVTPARGEDPRAGTNGVATEIVVTATRTPTPVNELPADVTVLSAEDLNVASARNPDDALRSVEGVSVARSYGMGYGIPSQINIRGVPGQHRSLLLADGFPLNDASSGFLSVNEIPVGAAKQMEIVRGPFSALYGSDALSGVMNILTPEPGAGPLAEAGVGAGNGGYWDGHLSSSGNEGGVAYWLYLDRRSIDNYVARDYVLESYYDPTLGQYLDIRRPADNYDYDDTRLLGKVALDAGDASHLTLHGRYFDSQLGYGQVFLDPAMPPIDSDTANRTIFGGADLTTEWSKELGSEFSAFVRGQKREMWGVGVDAAADGSPSITRSYSHNDGTDWQVAERLNWQVTDNNTVGAGAEFHQVACDFSPQFNSFTGRVLPFSLGEDEHIENTGVYVQDAAELTQRLRLLTALRLDVNSEFGEAVSPRAGLVYDVDPITTLRASAGRAFRAPSLLELYQPAVYFGNLVYQGNPDLDAEYIFSADAGIEHRVGKTLKLHADGFYNDMNDLITDQLNGTINMYMNVDQAWSAGVESGVEWTLDEGLALFANYTYQESEDKATGLDLPYTPNHMANAGVRGSHRFGRYLAEASLTENYVGKRGYEDTSTGMWRESDPYFRTDASLRITIQDRFWVAAGAQNLLDETYQETSVLDPAPGLLWTLEAGIRF